MTHFMFFFNPNKYNTQNSKKGGCFADDDGDDNSLI